MHEAEHQLPITSKEMMKIISRDMDWYLDIYERDIIRFIFERTYLYSKVWDTISEDQFLQGIEGVRPPLCMGRSKFYASVEALERKFMIHKEKKSVRSIARYSLNHLWKPTDIGPSHGLQGSTTRTDTSTRQHATVGDITKGDITGRVRMRARKASSNVNSPNVNSGNVNMGLLDDVHASAVAASTKHKAARDKRKKKLNATALYKIWQDAFRVAYPDDKMFAWLSHEQPAFRRAMDRGVLTDDMEAFVTFCVTGFDNVIAKHFKWMKDRPKLPVPWIVIKYVDIFYRAFEEDRDPNKKVLRRIAAATPEPVEEKKEDLSSEEKRELAALRHQNKQLKTKLAVKSTEETKRRRLRVKGFIRAKEKATLTGPFTKWD